METLKLIPQVFFDLLARVIPGSVGLVLYFILFRKNLGDIIIYLFGKKIAESGTLSFLIFLGIGYVIGELISPAAKMVQRVNETKIPLSYKQVKKAIENCRKRREKKKETIETEKLVEEEKFSERKLRYDRLRLEKPEVGALCAKIRAEFTMHNGLAVVFALSCFCYPFSVLRCHWYILPIFLLMTLVTAYRGRTTNKTFNETVAKFTQILNEGKSTTK